MKTKPINPYTALMTDVVAFFKKVKNLKHVTAYSIPKDALEKNAYSFNGVHERLSAAHALGFDAVIQATPDGLTITYVERAPTPPWRWTY